jgi:membrane protein implicated in regulation of membrane protease activity
MPDWVLWAILAVLLAAGEVATTSFILGPIAIAAVAAALVAAAGGGILLELLVFIACSVATLLFIRPIATRHLRMPARIRTGTAALVGARALVLEEVSATGGQVKIGGEVWTARAYDEDQVIPAGARVEVVKIEGATALVYE